MKYSGKGFVVFIYFTLLFLVSCSTSQSTVSTNTVSGDSLTYEQKFEFKYQFFEANKAYLTGNYDLALSLFNGCLKIDPYSAVCHYKVASVYLVRKDYSVAQSHAEKAAAYAPDNIWYLYLAGNLYTQNNNIEKAKETFNRLISIDNTEIDFYLSLADVYLKDNDISGALKVYNTIEEQFGISEIISLQKHKLYLSQNKKKEALNELIVLSDSNPGNLEYRRLVADFYVQTNDITNAFTAYNAILLDYPEDGFSRIGLAECYRKQNNLPQSFIELKLAFKSDNVPSDVKFNLLLSLIQNIQSDPIIQEEAFLLSEILINKYPNDPDIATIYANFLLQKNQLEEARNVLIDVIKVRKDKYAVWEQLVLLDNQFANWNDMFDHTNEALIYFPNQSMLYFFNGFSAFQLEKFEKAIKSLSFGYKLITQNDPLVLDYLTFLGESNFKLGNKEKAYEYFDKILALDASNIMVLNNYAYYLSEDNMDLDKAEKMSKITIVKEPNNATYLDTYAWILFKAEKYDEALIYMERAVTNDSDLSDVVLEHYGDVLFFNNRVDDAVKQWILAKEKGEGSGLLEEKISTKTYVQ